MFFKRAVAILKKWEFFFSATKKFYSPTYGCRRKRHLQQTKKKKMSREKKKSQKLNGNSFFHKYK